jgi:hypothetical protein
MAKEIWQDCGGENYIGVMDEIVWRIVEAQEITATRKLVDSLDEQIILEEMIDSIKPQIPEWYRNFHPLLYTAFRYPPLKYGSRFGRRYEPALWYGSLQPRTAMAEKAFYQFNFLRGSAADYGMVTLQLTLFATGIKTDKAVKLTTAPFSDEAAKISAPDSYAHSQPLGSAMRAARVHAFNYQSARDAEGGINIGIFTPKAFLHKKPESKSLQSWQCVIDHRVIEFMRSSAIEFQSQAFPVENFLVNGKLPFPACQE